MREYFSSGRVLPPTTGMEFVGANMANAQLAPTKQTLRWNNMAAARYAQRAPPLSLPVGAILSSFVPSLYVFRRLTRGTMCERTSPDDISISNRRMHLLGTLARHFLSLENETDFYWISNNHVTKNFPDKFYFN